MNAAPLYRPQLGVGGGVVSGGQPNQLSGQHQHGNGPINERDDRGRMQGGGYSEANSPLSPSAGSDFSFSRYNSNDTYPPQRNLAYPNNEPPMPTSGSKNSLISQRSSGSNSTPRDSVVVEHYAALKKYLTRHLAAEGLNQRQNKAREKLIRLSKQQFNELSTDVYDELMRRQNTSNSIPEDRMSLTPANQPFLVPKENFHPKRNQARQKLATLPPGRFKELASDVLYEIERRYPVSVEAANNNQYLSTEENMQRTTSASSFGSQRSDQSYNTPYSSTRSDGIPNSSSRDRFPSSISSNNLATPPIPEEGTPEEGAIQRTGMQNTIIPNKSTMIEEDGPEDDTDTLQRSLSKNTPVQKSLQSNTIVPNTSTMVEESTDEEDPADDDRRVASTIAPSITASSKSLSPPVFKSNTFANASLNGMKNRSVSPPPMLPKSRSQLEAEERKEREMQEKLEEYEDKIEALKERIAELQEELKSTKEDLRVERAKSPPPVPAGNDRRLRELEAENDRLREELREQQEVTNDVRREATELLEEMKSLTSQQDSLFDTQTNSTREVTRLQAEIREWKTRYSQLKVQVRSNASSMVSSSHLNSPLRMDLKSRVVATEDGVIEDGSISRFQNSIDDLLAAARRDDGEILEIMTEVVKATRAISDDLKRFGSRDVEEDPKVRKLTTRLSATANNLITATKNHASSQGISPVSLVDAAASHLTSTVVDLVKVVKVRPGSGATSFRLDEDAQSDHSRYSEIQTPITSPMGSVSPSHNNNKALPVPLSLGSRSNLAPRNAMREDVYPARSPDSPRSVDSRRSSRNAYPSKDEEELRLYLDTQTQAIVESIQSLLTRIRNPKLDSLDDFRPQIDEIVTIVEKIVDYSERQGGKIDRLSGENGRMMTILHSLEDCCSSMRSISRSTATANSEDGFKKRLARIAFDISKQIKELVRIVESDSPTHSTTDLSYH